MNPSEKIEKKTNDLLAHLSFKAFFENSHLPKAFLNKNGDLLAANRAYLDFFEVPDNTFLPTQSIFNLFKFWQEYYKDLFQLVREKALTKFKTFTHNHLQLNLYKPHTQTKLFYNLELRPLLLDYTTEVFWELSIMPQSNTNFNTNFINQILDTVPNLIMLRDFEGKIIFCSSALAEYCLVSKEQILGKTIHHFFQTEVPLDDYLKIEHAVLLSQMELRGEEKFVRLADNKVFYFHSIKKSFLNANGNLEILCVMTDVTDKKLQQQEVEKHRNLLNGISQAIPDDLLLIDIDQKKIAYTNKQVFNNGFDLQEISQMLAREQLVELVYDLDKNLFFEALRQIYTYPEQIQRVEVRIKQKDGSFKWYWVRFKAFNSDKQKPTRFVLLLFQDIHKEKEQKAQLEISEKKLRQVYELSNLVTWEYDITHKKFSYDDRFLPLFGINKSKEIKKISQNPLLLLQYVHLKDRTFQDIVWKTLQENKRYEGEHQITKRNGETVYIYIIISQEYDLQGKPSKIQGIIQDISAQKFKQTELKKQFLRTETIYHLTANIADNLQEQIYKVLKATCNLLNVETGLILRQEEHEFVVEECFTQVHRFQKGMTMPLHAMICHAVVLTNRILVIKDVSHSIYNDYECVQRYGINFYVGVPIWVAGRCYGVMSFWSSRKEVRFETEDESFLRMILQWVNAAIERNMFEKELVIAKEKAEQASQAKAQFLSTISHELRTPLNAILGLTHLLLQKKPRKEQEESLQVINFSARNLLMLINDLLDFSKLEAKKIILENEPFSLKELIQNIATSFKPQVKEKGIRFSVWLDPNIPDILLGDSLRIGQILTNLVGNAVKFTEKGEVELKISIKHEQEQNIMLYFVVKDTGIGIPADKIDIIFEAFTQASIDTARRFGGTGLGLTITQKLLELHQSTLMVESIEGKGSTFSFYLQLSKAKDQSKKVLEKQAPSLEKPQDLGEIWILVAEDHSANRLLIKEFLTSWHFQVDFACNGQEAIDKLSNQKYHLVLMDLQMPILGGLEATQKIRSKKEDYFQKIPIIALTADVSPGVRQQIRLHGLNDYLSKPFNPEQLLKSIVKYLKKQPNTSNYQLPKDMKLAQSIFQLSQENPEFKQEFLRLNIEYMTELPVEYEEAIWQGDAKRLGDIAHKAKPTIEMLGIPELAEAIAEGRKLVNTAENTPEKVKDVIQKIKKICQDTIIQLKNE
ncbi:MAG: ATP-binding protein [Microscillaceae bacterium]|nr:ATP-binding protein [Microscillaceae bacterium]MDW8460754.1 ATP-binding protein [Cytophagales bacterium]